MEHQSLYRKYRSQAFDDVVGQQHVTKTLQNALSGDRVAHAYLFCGPRGTGKTSTARLLAKALNCSNGPTPSPCNECELCRSITSGRALDVVEVDAASETGIDNVREVIINNSRYAPALGRYKVYIIDEVHDLSRAAFDGLLKTLEEPPAHVVFVLATTEIHKVPATIISRCQRFEFRRGSLDEVRGRVEFVAQQEGVTLEPAAATLIARAAQGGWRDALSLLEQVVSFGERTITARDVGLVLGAIEDEHLEALARHVAAGDPVGSLSTLDSLLAEGKDLRQLLHNFSDYLRDCLLHTLGAATEVSRPLVAIDAATGMHMLEQASRAEREMRWNTQHRLVLELMLLRMAAPRTETAAVPLVSKSSSSASAPSSPVISRQSQEPAGGPGLSPSSEPFSPPDSSRASAPAASRTTGRPVIPAPAAPIIPSAAPAPVFAKAVAPDESPDASMMAEAAARFGGPAASNVSLDLQTIQAQWKSFLSRVGTKSRKLQALLREATPSAYVDGALTLEFKLQYHCQAVEEVNARREIETVFGVMFGAPVRVTCKLTEDSASRETAEKPTRKMTDPPITDGDLAELFPGWEIHEG